jgi:peptidyl-dipeptidase A
MWAQYWTGIDDLVGPGGSGARIDVTALLKANDYTPTRIVETGENFFVSLGFPKLPATFWERSMLVQPEGRKVDCQGSAFSIDPAIDDVRMKMCVHVTEEDFQIVHHELGHIYYYLAYSDQPFLFRFGANPGFHEAIGDAIALSITPEYLHDIGLLIDSSVETNDLPYLFRIALDKIPRLAMAIVVDMWRWKVFSGEITPEEYNAGWWDLRHRYQGLSVPVPRSEDDFDAGMFYHVSFNVPFDRYFIAMVLQFDFHRALCEAAGHTGPLHECSIYGSEASGERLAKSLARGSSQPWPETLQELTGRSEIDASSVVDYFAPVMTWLAEQNRSRECGW